MPRNDISKEEIAHEIRKKMKYQHGVELTEKETFQYMENSGAYTPSVPAIEKFIANQVRLREMLKRTQVDCSVRHAIYCLRYPFTPQGQIGSIAVARVERDVREA